jgi:hypothetical protein
MLEEGKVPLLLNHTCWEWGGEEVSGTSATCYMQELNYMVTFTTSVKGQGMGKRGANITFGCLGEWLAAVVFLNW